MKFSPSSRYNTAADSPSNVVVGRFLTSRKFHTSIVKKIQDESHERLFDNVIDGV